MPRVGVDQRTRQIVDAASRVIVREGLAKATTRRIAEEAGIALGIIHYAFRSKQEMLTAVYDDWSASIADIAGAVEAGCGVAPAARQLALATIEWVIEDLNLGVAQYELLLWAVREGSDEPMSRRIYQRYVEFFGEALERAAEPGTDPETISETLDRLLVVLDGVVIRLLSTGDREDAYRLLDLMLAE